MDPNRCTAFLDDYRSRSPDWAREYLRIHETRFRLTLQAIPEAAGPKARAVEFGTYGLFPLAMADIGGYAVADGTTWEKSPFKTFTRKFDFDPQQRDFRMFDVDLEQEMLPIEGGYYDFVLCAEVIEHMATDPMAVFWEMNRVLRPGGRALVTTPNVACANNVDRILRGEVPNSYYKYRSARSSDRHNLEYSPRLLADTLEAAGLRVDRLWTEQCWNPALPDLLATIGRLGYPTELRNDNIFVLVSKTAEPKERFPEFLYD